MTEVTIGVIVGSTRDGSHTQALADRLPEFTDAQLHPITGIDLLPHFHAGLEADPPQSVLALRQAVAAVDAVLVVTPEYNGAMPGMVKNALDWLSRPRAESVMADKPAAAIGVSPGGRGGAGAMANAIAVLTRVRAAVVPEGVSVPHAAETVPDLPDDLAGQLRHLLEALVASVRT